MYFDLTEWVDGSNMTATEKEEHPLYETTGGFLRVHDYKDAWKKAWDGASNDERKATLALPNFDASIFREITGIDVADDGKKSALLSKADEPTKKAEELKAEAERI